MQVAELLQASAVTQKMAAWLPSCFRCQHLSPAEESSIGICNCHSDGYQDCRWEWPCAHDYDLLYAMDVKDNEDDVDEYDAATVLAETVGEVIEAVLSQQRHATIAHLATVCPTSWFRTQLRRSWAQLPPQIACSVCKLTVAVHRLPDPQRISVYATLQLCQR